MSNSAVLVSNQVCPYCGGRVKIDGSHIIADQVRNVYCQCTNKHCKHRYVVQMTFVHTISPPLSLKISQKLPISAELRRKLAKQGNDNFLKTNGAKHG